MRPFVSLPRRCSGYCNWLIASAAVAALVLTPILALVVIALGGEADVWRHLVTNVLPSVVPATAILLAGVAVVVVLIGTGSAWLVTAYDFPGRRTLDWALLLPLAVPTYVVAFAYVDLLHPIGPVQSALRALLGIADPQGLRLPDVRSMPGAILLFGMVLYPYVYLSVRALFLMQAAGLIETARMLSTGRRAFFRVALPLARPAIAIGASLALMETLNDIGASQFLGIRTMTVSVYSTWVNQSNLAGAAEIALVMLAIVVVLIVLERAARRGRRYTTATQRSHVLARKRLSGKGAALALVLGAAPVLLGFVVPALHLASQATRRIGFAGFSDAILAETANTLIVSVVATAIALVLGVLLAYAARLDRGRIGKGLVRVAGLGYALPGTVLAIGLFIPLAGLDNLVDGWSRGVFGMSTGLMLSGSLAILVYAYVARFLAIAAGGIEAGFDKIAPSLDQSARTLGRTPAGVLRAVHLRLIRPALGATAILVFVDCMKELPATLLLRPLNFETLATHIYAEAVRGTYEDGAVAALAIIAAGLAPVILLARLGRPAVRGKRPTP